MARKTKTSDRVTLALRLADGTRIEVEAGVHCMRFIGRYSRISAFGPLGTRITAQLVARD
ncbi:MAG TPA: hypothetical protein VGE65_03070 [Sphingobium sp.]